MCSNKGTLKYRAKKKLSSCPETLMTRVRRAYHQYLLAEALEPVTASDYRENLGKSYRESKNIFNGLNHSMKQIFEHIQIGHLKTMVAPQGYIFSNEEMKFLRSEEE